MSIDNVWRYETLSGIFCPYLAFPLGFHLFQHRLFVRKPLWFVCTGKHINLVLVPNMLHQIIAQMGDLLKPPQ